MHQTKICESFKTYYVSAFGGKKSTLTVSLAKAMKALPSGIIGETLMTDEAYQVEIVKLSTVPYSLSNLNRRQA